MELGGAVVKTLFLTGSAGLVGIKMQDNKQLGGTTVWSKFSLIPRLLPSLGTRQVEVKQNYVYM